MTTIDQLDISVYNLYAVRTKMIEQINQQLQLDKAFIIPPQTFIVDTYPKIGELDLLFSVGAAAPIGYYLPPPRIRARDTRRSPFAFFRVIPSLGSLGDQKEDEEALERFVCQSEEEENEKTLLKKCLSQIDEINDWLGHIIGRVGQFLQG